jgi:hypothetical protein
MFGQVLQQPADERTCGIAKLHPPQLRDQGGDTRRGRREAPPGEAVGRRAHAGLAFEASVYPGALREEAIELSEDDQGGVHPAVVLPSALSIHFEMVCK